MIRSWSFPVICIFIRYGKTFDLSLFSKQGKSMENPLVNLMIWYHLFDAIYLSLMTYFITLIRLKCTLSGLLIIVSFILEEWISLPLSSGFLSCSAHTVNQPTEFFDWKLWIAIQITSLWSNTILIDDSYTPSSQLMSKVDSSFQGSTNQYTITMWVNHNSIWNNTDDHFRVALRISNPANTAGAYFLFLLSPNTSTDV